MESSSTWFKNTGRPAVGHPFSSLNPNASEFVPRFNSAPAVTQPPILHTSLAPVRPCLPPNYTIVSPMCQVSNVQRPPFSYQQFPAPVQVPHAVDKSFKASEHWTENKQQRDEPLRHQIVEEKSRNDNFQTKNNYGYSRGGPSRGYKHSPERPRQKVDLNNLKESINQSCSNENAETIQQEQYRNHDRNYKERGSNRREPSHQHNKIRGDVRTEDKRKENHEEQQRNYERSHRGSLNMRGREEYRSYTDRRAVQRNQNNIQDISYRPQNRNDFYRGRGGQRSSQSREESCSYDKELFVKNERLVENIYGSRGWDDDTHEIYNKPPKNHDRGRGRGGYRYSRGKQSPNHHNTERHNLGDSKEGRHPEKKHEKRDGCIKEESQNRHNTNSIEKQNRTCENVVDIRQNELKDKIKPVNDESIESPKNTCEHEQHPIESESTNKNVVEERHFERRIIIRDKSPSKSRGRMANERPRTQRQNRDIERNGSDQDPKNLSQSRGRFSTRDFQKNNGSKPRGRGNGNRGNFIDRKPSDHKSSEIKDTSSEEPLSASESSQNTLSETPTEKDTMSKSWIQEMEEDERYTQQQTQEVSPILSWRIRDNDSSTTMDRRWDKNRKIRRFYETPNGEPASWRNRSNTVQELSKLRDPRMERENRDVNPKLSEFDHWEKQWTSIQQKICFEEIEGNLFDTPKEFSLAHCVAEDFRMSSGIAVDFKREFNNQAQLLDQHVTSGGLGILFDDDHQRFIYYLVTKRESVGKPTYQTLWESLVELRSHIKENKVSKLAMPRLGCGLDRLEWNKVKAMIAYLFDNIEIEICVYHFVQNEPIEEKKSHSTKFVVEDSTALTNMHSGTLLLYFSDTEGTCDETMQRLSSKFNFIDEFNQHTPKALGDIIYCKDPATNYGICGCIVRESPNKAISYKALHRCMESINENNKSDDGNVFAHVGMQWLNREAYLDEIVNQKIITIMINILKDISIHICKGSFGDEGE